MKKKLFVLLILLICISQNSAAYEYFTICFSDGTRSEAFYATDVDSICYSKIGLDSLEYVDWQVQEIYTCDSVYRYSLAQIDSLSFKDVDINQVAEDIAHINEVVSTLFNTNPSTIDMEAHVDWLNKIDGIDDAYMKNQTLYIKLRDWGYISFYNPITDSDFDDGLDLSVLSQSRIRAANDASSNEHQHINALKACIVNQQFKDEKRSSFIEIADQLEGMFNYLGIEAKTINMPSVSFFSKEMFNYDILFIKTHGDYEEKSNLHWLCTGEELWSYNPKKDDINVIREFIKTTIPRWLNNGISPNKISTMCVAEVRGGEKVHVYYTAISDEYIKSAARRFNHDGVIVFNSACESMMKNYNLARAFTAKGAGCYLGYNASNSIGGLAGKNFFAQLSVGKSVYSAYNALPEWLKQQTIFIDDQDEVYFEAQPVGKRVKKYTPQLKSYPEKSTLCITHPETISAEELSEVEKKYICLKGRLKLYPLADAFGNSELGFELSTSSNMLQDFQRYGENEGVFYIPQKPYLNCNINLDFSQLQPNTTYYYRAYMYDGYSNCYGEIKSFTTPDNNPYIIDDNPYIIDDNAEPYYVWDEASKTVTYYYDGKRKLRNGNWGRWRYRHEVITASSTVVTVVFDLTFSKYFPTWFSFIGCKSLQSIENIQYLNTDSITEMHEMFKFCESFTSLDLSSFKTDNVTGMGMMFSCCSNLTSLDLSSFNTSNVTGLSGMFKGCKSLTSLDLSSFNTSNVTEMSDVFEGCSSLTSLDLSNFNTSNVTLMEGMFEGCSSLTSLDLSNFNTSNVTYMRGMFDGCSSLTSLDLSNFNTSNVRNMSIMFRECKSLTNLDLSSFNTSNLGYLECMFYGCSSLARIYACNWDKIGAYSGYMFCGCSNLVGGKGTKIGDNYYYDKNGNLRSYGCGYDGEAAHIDGGKDNPGLFTEK